MNDGETIDSQTKILLLKNAPEAIPTLRDWFKEEWAPWYGPGGPGDAEGDLLECCNSDCLPLAVVAIDDSGQVVGTAALRPESLGSEFGYGPWLAAVLVTAPHRQKGIGNALIGSIETEARRLGINSVYVSTDTAAALIRRRGWERTGRQVESLRGWIPIFRLDL